MQTAKWSTYSVQAKTSSNFSKFYCNGELQNKTVSKYDCPNSRDDRIGSTRVCRTEPQLPINIFSSSQARWQPPPNIQFKTVEQICCNETVPTLQPFSYTNLSPTPRLDGQNGPEPSVLPHSYCTTASPFFEAQLSARSESPSIASDDVLTFRTGISTKNVCHRDQLGCRAIEKSRHQMCGLSGRLPVGKPVGSQPSRRYSNNNTSNAVIGLENKLRKVCSHSDSMPRVSWHNMGHKTQRNVPLGAEVPIATQSTSGTAEYRQVVPKTISATDGETQLCHFRNKKGSSSLSNAAILQSTIVKESPLPPSNHTAASSNRNRMVVQLNRSKFTDSYECRVPFTDDRRVRYRLGSSDQRSFYCGYMEQSTDVVARQQKRDVRRIRRDTARTRSSEKCASTPTDRQPHGSIIYQQRGRHEVEETSGTNSTASHSFRQTERASPCAILSRKVQRRSGRAITPENLSGVASNNNGNSCHISNVGYTRDGPFCVKNSSCDTEVRLDGCSGSPGAASQRLLSPVALRTGVVIPTSESDSESSQSPQPGQRKIHTDCSKMEQSVLASRCPTSSAAAPLSDSRPSSNSSRHSNGCPPSGNQRSAIRSMADFGWEDMLKEWSEKEQELLMKGWRPSTMNTYKPAWTRWRKWCASHSIDFKHPNADQVARYLAYLHCDIGLAYRTILVHKSVISTFTHLNSDVDLSSNFFIKHMLKAISVSRTKPVKPPIWNPKLLLEYLCTYCLDENSLYQVSKHTATLLLLASGRRVHDLTLLRIDSNSLIDDQTSILLWPVFGSKTDNVNHRQSGWRLREHPDKKLNVVFWIRQLLTLSFNRRQNINNLFITARGEPKPATRTVIGGWVKALLKDADIEASPGSVRSAVASLNWLENFPIDKILDTGNWKTVHTFQNYYQREIIDPNSDINKSVSLSNYFDAVID